MLRPFILVFLVVVAACSGATHTLKLINQTSRRIEAVYVYPVGASSHGASRGALAPNTAIVLKVQAGNVEVLAVGAKERVNERETERKQASQIVELRAPIELVFHDSDQPHVDRPGTIGVVFRVPEPEPAPLE